MVSRHLAWEKLNQMLDNANLVKHCLAVEAAMLAYAQYFDVPETEQEQWAVAGLIHDADWEKYPDQHPQVILKWLEQQQAGDQVINAVAAHGADFGVEPKSLMAKSLRAVDELTGLITAVALVKGRDLSQVTVSSVKKKWGKKDFARGVNRLEIEQATQSLGVGLDQHIELVLSAMQQIAGQLGLDGK